jgi:hypothetical protein
MPRKLSRGKRLVTTAGIAAVAALALPGAAMAAECPVQPTTAAFSAHGDDNHYFLAPGGAFESLSQWDTRGRVSLLSGLNLLGLAAGTRSAELEQGEGVTSATFCVDRTMPHLRFSAKADGSGQLDVTVWTRDHDDDDDWNSSGGSVSSDDHRSWAPSRYVALNTSSIPAGESTQAVVQFRSQGDWVLDDVYIDPYRR